MLEQIRRALFRHQANRVSRYSINAVWQATRAAISAMQFYDFPDVVECTCTLSRSDPWLRLYFDEKRQVYVIIHHSGIIYLANETNYQSRWESCDYLLLKKLLMSLLHK